MHERAGAGRAARHAGTRVETIIEKPLHGPLGGRRDTPTTAPITAPILAVVAFPTARETAEAAVRLAGDLDARLLFVSVERAAAETPAAATSLAGSPTSLSRSRERFRAHQALDVALSAATRAGIAAHAEVIEAAEASELQELARSRGARLLAVGHPVDEESSETTAAPGTACVAADLSSSVLYQVLE
jgi:nucleotide-binding universal stress UspA family protein